MILFLVLLLGGNLLLVAGLFLTRWTWRPDVERFSRESPLLQIIIHPERFARPDRLRPIRLFNLLGALLLGGSIGVLVSELIVVTRGR